MRIYVGLIAAWRRAGVQLAEVGEQELVVSCPLGAIRATARRWRKLRIALIEWGEFQNEEDVRLNPELQAADRKQDAFRLLPTRTPILFEASGERLFLLIGLELRQQERMADADLLAVKRIDDVLR
jgi:hypothetical protein